MLEALSKASPLAALANDPIEGLLSNLTKLGSPLESLVSQFSNMKPVSELAGLQELAKTGTPLTPVQQGTLERLLASGSEAPVASTAVTSTDKKSGVKEPITIDDLKLTNATEQDKVDLKAALEYLQAKDAKGNYKSPTAVKLLEGLRDKGTTINFIHDGNDAFDNSTNTIDWDPRSGLELVDNKGNLTGGTQSAALGLIHEADHAVNLSKKIKSDSSPYHDNEEKRVITGSEKRIAKDLGEPIRTNHSGNPVTLGSSTEFIAVPKK
jgi:hypothetical protein